MGLDHSNTAIASTALGFCLGSLAAGLRHVLLSFFGMEMVMTMKYHLNHTGSFLKATRPESKEGLREDRRFVVPHTK